MGRILSSVPSGVTLGLPVPRFSHLTQLCKVKQENELQEDRGEILAQEKCLFPTEVTMALLPARPAHAFPSTLGQGANVVLTFSQAMPDAAPAFCP